MTGGSAHSDGGDSNDIEAVLLTQAEPSDAHRAIGSADGTTNGQWILTLLSGESLTVRIDDLSSGVTAGDISARLETARPVEDQHEYRVFAGTRLLDDCDVVDSESLQDMSVVITERRKTTIMIKNIPFDFSPVRISKWLDGQGMGGRYDFINVCLDLKKVDISRGQNLGYCFVNFRSEADAQSSGSVLSNHQLGSRRGGTRVSFAQRHGTRIYQRSVRETLAHGMPHEQLGLRLGFVSFTADGSVAPLEEWLGVPTFPRTIELMSQVGHPTHAEGAEVINHVVIAHEPFQQVLLRRFEWDGSVWHHPS